MNTMFRIFVVCVMSVMLFTFPAVAQCADVQPAIARAVSASMDSENTNKLGKSSIDTELDSDHSAQVTQRTLSFLLDGSENVIIMHGCSEAAAVCP